MTGMQKYLIICICNEFFELIKRSWGTFNNYNGIYIIIKKISGKIFIKILS